jgi:outer membrane biosynthesis protein TonB
MNAATTAKIESESRTKGMLISGSAHTLLLLLLFFLTLDMPKMIEEKEEEKALMIDFGGGRGSGDDWREAGSTGSGSPGNNADVVKVQVVQSTPATPAPSPSAVKTTTGENLITQNTEDAVAMAEARKKAAEEQKKLAAEAEAKRKVAEAAAKVAAEQKAREEEAAKLKAMLDNKLKTSGSGTGTGTGSGTGGPGSGSGTGSGTGTGSGSGTGWGPGGGDGSGSGSGTGSGDGIGHDLAGRKMIKAPTINDNSQKTGKVAIRVKVDKSGRVLSAEYSSKGSTTTDSYLVGLSTKAAMEARFNSDSNAAEEQFGLIFFTFRVQ